MVLNKHQKKVTRFRFYWRSDTDTYIFRHDPVPHIHKCGNGGWYRHPKTFNEMKQSFGFDKNYIRGKRKKHNLPDSWDDVHRTRTKSWKKHRKTQYKSRDIV